MYILYVGEYNIDRVAVVCTLQSYLTLTGKSNPGGCSNFPPTLLDPLRGLRGAFSIALSLFRVTS